MIGSNQKYKINYAIISAMPEELDFFRQTFLNCSSEEIRVGEFYFKIIDYKQNKILISATGLGTAFAASVLTLINSYFKPDYVLVSGTAGGIKENIKLRDVIIAEYAFEAEIQDIMSMVNNTPFESCLKHPLKCQYFPAHYVADPELLSHYDSLNFADIHCYKGTVVSSNAFPAPKELFEKIKKFNPYSIDMETSAFYQIAWLLNIKIIVVRGISNILNTDGTDDNIHESDVKGSSEAAASVLLAILDKSIAMQNHNVEAGTVTAEF